MAFISVEIVQAWCPHVTKFIRIRRGKFDGLSGVDGDGQYGHPARLQDSTDFRYCFVIIGDMFQHMRCKDNIIGPAAEWKTLKIHHVIGPLHLQVGSFIWTKTLRENSRKNASGAT